MPMQPQVDATRGLVTVGAAPVTVTGAQVVSLLRDAPAIRLRGGLEIIDLALNVIEDVSDSLIGGEVGRDSYAHLHGDASFKLTRELDWAGGIVRPYVVVSGATATYGNITARFNLGAYHPTIPEQVTGGEPWDVGGFDMLLRLDDPVGDAYAIASGDSYLSKAVEILNGRGYTAYVVDWSGDKTAPTDRTWVFDDQTTWLTIVNDMLASIGYAGIWSDWDGRLHLEPYVLPQSRSSEWTYSDDVATSMIGIQRTLTRDYTDTPNRWVIYRSNNVDDTTPVEGAGIVTLQNDNIGDTSITNRGGRVITRVQGEDVADQGALIARANQIAQTDMDLPQVISGTLPRPNWLHWHFDRNYLRLPEYLGDVQCTAWRVPLPPDLGDMTVTFRAVTQ